MYKNSGTDNKNLSRLNIIFNNSCYFAFLYKRYYKTNMSVRRDKDNHNNYKPNKCILFISGKLALSLFPQKRTELAI